MNQTTVGINMKLPADIHTSDDGKWFIAHCPVFDVSSQGKTKKKAINNLIEAVSQFLITSMEKGTFDAVMKECGFHPDTSAVRRRKTSDHTYIDVPINLIATENGDYTRCHHV